MRLTGVIRVFCLILMVLLQGLLLAWAGAAPLVWIVRDGLGPDMVESGWALSVCKFLALWGIPALALTLPLFVLSRVERRLARSKARRQAWDGRGQDGLPLERR